MLSYPVIFYLFFLLSLSLSHSGSPGLALSTGALLCNKDCPGSPCLMEKLMVQTLSLGSSGTNGYPVIQLRILKRMLCCHLRELTFRPER